jgi:putative aldouronate transport system permease protein
MKGKEKQKKKISLELTLLALPGLALILLFKIIPLYGLIIPFKRINFAKGIFGSDWIGLRNFEFFFRSNDAFRVTRNTLLFNFAGIIIGTTVCITLALLLFELPRTQVKIYQTAMFIPYFLSWIVVSYILYAFLNPAMGFIPVLMKNMGKEVPQFYTNPYAWILILPLVGLWKGMGYSTLLYYASLLSIDPTLFEAAAIDGATKLQRTWYISIPHLVALVTLMLVLSIGGIFNSDFGMFFFLTRDSGPLYPITDTIDTYVYRALRVTGDIGMSAAVGLYQTIVGFILVLVSNLIIRKLRPESSIF